MRRGDGMTTETPAALRRPDRLPAMLFIALAWGMS